MGEGRGGELEHDRLSTNARKEHGCHELNELVKSRQAVLRLREGRGACERAGLSSARGVGAGLRQVQAECLPASSMPMGRGVFSAGR